MYKKFLTIVAMGILFFSLGSVALAQNEKTESLVVFKSGTNLNEILQHTKHKKNVNNQTYAMKKFTEPLVKNIKGIKVSDKYAINNFIVYGTQDTRKLSALKRYEMVKQYITKYNKPPVNQLAWENLLRINIKSASTTVQPKCNVYNYQDTFYLKTWRQCMDEIVIRPVYFVAKDQSANIPLSTLQNMSNIYSKVKTFYEGQFVNKISIEIESPIVIKGDKDLGYYNSNTLATEVKNKTPKISTSKYLDLQIFINNEKNIQLSGAAMIGDIDKTGDYSLASVNPSYWLENDILCTVATKYGTSCQDYIGAAHEFGHSLGLPHPWEMAINKNKNGDILNTELRYSERGNVMSYNSGPLLSGNSSNPFGEYFIMKEQIAIMTNSSR